jgi:hypothetical protein
MIKRKKTKREISSHKPKDIENAMTKGKRTKRKKTMGDQMKTR